VEGTGASNVVDIVHGGQLSLENEELSGTSFGVTNCGRGLDDDALLDEFVVGKLEFAVLKDGEIVRVSLLDEAPRATSGIVSVVSSLLGPGCLLHANAATSTTTMLKGCQLNMTARGLTGDLDLLQSMQGHSRFVQGAA
jgi:hypothetical protein